MTQVKTAGDGWLCCCAMLGPIKDMAKQ